MTFLMNVIQACIVKASLIHGVDVSVMNAVASLESTYDIKATSKTNDYGLMQLHGRKIYDPCKNAVEGAKLLKEAKSKLTHRLGDAWIIGYNLGVTGAKRFSKKGARKFAYYKRFKEHYRPLNMLDMLLFKDLPRINKVSMVLPYRMF